MPSDKAAIEMRPPSSTRIASMKPSPSLPSKFSAGTTQSSKIISAVSLARNPSLFSFRSDAAAIEHAHCVDEAVAFLAQQILCRNHTIFKNHLRRVAGPQPQLVLFPI